MAGMQTVGLVELALVAQRLAGLEERFAFVGGCVLPLLLDESFRSSVRSTFDADVIVGVVSRTAEARLDERLRSLGFHHDTRPSAPRCRWLLDGMTVDVMAQGPGLEFATEWLTESLAEAVERDLASGLRAPVITPACFLAVKLHAFRSRGCPEGRPDYYGSKDLEDIITLVEGRASLVSDVAQASPKMRRYVAAELGRLMKEQGFRDSLTGHLAVSSPAMRVAVRARIEETLQRIRQIEG